MDDLLLKMYRMYNQMRGIPSPSQLYQEQQPSIGEKLEYNSRPYGVDAASPEELQKLRQLPPSLLQQLEKQALDRDLNLYRMWNNLYQFRDRDRFPGSFQYGHWNRPEQYNNFPGRIM